MSREDRARELIQSLRGMNRNDAIDEINNLISGFQASKRNSNYGPEMNEIERALRILYDARDNL